MDAQTIQTAYQDDPAVAAAEYGAICDEIGFWRAEDSAKPGSEYGFQETAQRQSKG